jgi:flavin reductase (DIM6/NTAB) family NADH-FMN oxidoreductase RutF/nitroreductase
MSQALQQDFRKAMRCLAATVCVVSIDDGGEWNGMTATSVTSVSMDPASMLVCINHTASLHQRLQKGVRLCVNVLKTSQAPLAGAFSTSKIKGAQRFANGDWQADDSGLPYLADAQANMFCTIDLAVPYGTHTIFVAKVDGVRVMERVAPLLYQDGQYAATTRISDYDIDPLFLMRWSPRAFTEESIAEEELMTLFEAARWAPSCFNSQPWRFLYARRGTPDWDRFVSLLIPFNQEWARNAAALVFIVSNTMMTDPATGQRTVSPTHTFDAGAAWAQLGLQATKSGWRAHAMAGFDHERARIELNVPDGYRIEAAIAIGRQGDRATLAERLQDREVPSTRIALDTITLEGGFPKG